jgi:hypothetical protein
MLKYLRIAVTALSLTACVLLVALWVRSYWRNDAFTGGHFLYIGARAGKVGMLQWRPGDARRWRRIASTPISADDAHSSLLFASPIESPPRKLLGFRWIIHQNQREIEAPIWVPVLFAAILAVAPWVRWSSRFSLRTLLIATTLIAVGLGMVVALS